MRTWRLLVGFGVGVSSVGLWSALPAHAEEPVKPVEAAKPAAKPTAPSKAAAKPKCKSGMVGIPAGTFTMGDDMNTEKAGTVHVDAFCMDRSEVTVSAYKVCVESGNCTAVIDFGILGHEHDGPRKQLQGRNAPNSFTTTDANNSYRAYDSPFNECNAGVTGLGNHPINCVRYDQAMAYCQAQGQGLPTEEQWEYAARGTDGRLYPWGNAEPTNQECGGRNGRAGTSKPPGHTGCIQTCAVASYPAGNSPFGLADMAGNVAEWTSSGYDDQWVVIRGDRDGSKMSLRSAFRAGGNPRGHSFHLGFRCAGSPLP